MNHQQAYEALKSAQKHFLEQVDTNVTALAHQGELEQAYTVLQEALKIEENQPFRQFNAAMICVHLGRISEGLAHYKAAQASGLNIATANPLLMRAHSGYLAGLAYQPEITREAISKAHHEWYHLYGEALSNRLPFPTPAYETGQPIRIGMVSADFYSHPVGILMYGIIEHHPEQQFEFYLYSNTEQEDSLSQKFKQTVNSWRDIRTLNDEQAVQTIRDDGIHILMDLSGHTRGARLGIFCLRGAPVQVGFIGYWDTTGIQQMDYIMMDRHITPVSEDKKLYAEKVVYLPHSRFNFHIPNFAPPQRKMQDKGTDQIILACFNNVQKLNSRVFAVWAHILAAHPQTHLRIRWKTLDQPKVIAQVQRLAAEAGISVDRYSLEGGTSYDKILEEYNRVHVVLDPFPFSGGMTTLDTLWMGVPIVTLTGDRPVGRQTESFLKTLGLPQLIAHTEAEYVQIASALIQNHAARTAISEALLDRLPTSPLMDSKQYVTHFFDLLKTIWAMECYQH